jgi:hypothetical protein
MGLVSTQSQMYSFVVLHSFIIRGNYSNVEKIAIIAICAIKRESKLEEY